MKHLLWVYNHLIVASIPFWIYPCHDVLARATTQPTPTTTDAAFPKLNLPSFSKNTQSPDSVLSILEDIQGQVCLTDQCLSVAGWYASCQDGHFNVIKLPIGQKCIIEDGIARLVTFREAEAVKRMRRSFSDQFDGEREAEPYPGQGEVYERIKRAVVRDEL